MDIERLRWVVDFANQDLTGFREGDWLNLRDDLRQLLNRPIAGIEVKVAFEFQKESRERLGEIQNKLREFLRGVATNNMTLSDKRPGRKGILLEAIPLSLSYGCSFSWQSFLSSYEKESVVKEIPPAGIFASADDVYDAVLFAVMLLLAGLHDNLRTCPECDRIFFKIRKQRYCSKRCINAATRREWLKVPKNRKKESEWAHKRYERRVRKLMPHVTVQRRPRRGAK